MPARRKQQRQAEAPPEPRIPVAPSPLRVLIHGFWVSQLLHVAAALDLADGLAEGPLHPGARAERVGAVDVGGAHGHLLAAILRRHEVLTGVLYDRPQVVAGAEARGWDDERCVRILTLCRDAFEVRFGGPGWSCAAWCRPARRARR